MNLEVNLDAVRAAIRAYAAVPAERVTITPPAPVVTISRQAGIDVGAFVTELTERLNAVNTAEQQWVGYDRELVERVAEDHQLEERLVASLDEHDRSWFEHFLAGLGGQATGTDIAMKTARTIRGLARLGRAVIVGRGGQCILHTFPNAVHVRLVAASEWRAEQYAEAAGVPMAAAERAIREIEQERSTFVKRHFSRNVEDATLYDVVINVERVVERRAVAIVVGLLETV